MDQLIILALELYNLIQPTAEFIRHNENITYKITDIDKKYVLRIHKPVIGYSLDIFNMNDYGKLIDSELSIIESFKSNGLLVQTPIKGKNGNFIQYLNDNTAVSLLEWIEGDTIDNVEMTPIILYEIGKTVATMYAFFIENSSNQYYRYNYDQKLLVSVKHKMLLANQNKTITNEQLNLINDTLDEISKRFDELDNKFKKIIVHADLSKSNMIITADGSIVPIDFSLNGYSHFYMDIGGLFATFTNIEERKHLIDGYKVIRNVEINPYYIEPYFALQVLLFIACQYEKATHWDWFEKAMKRWCKEIFEPIITQKRFIFI